MMKMFILFVMCHMLGDYVLQTDFIAKTKGQNWYHLFVHCVLYCVPFAIVFGIDYPLCFIFIVHIITDVLKARYNKISYAIDQIIHLCCFAFVGGVFSI